MASFGEELKRERELRDISLKEISEATKISIRFLEALEQNNYDILPGGIFNRGFIRAYARFIGVDGEEMVNAYVHEMAQREARSAGTLAVAGAGAGAPAGAAVASGVFRPEPRPAQRVEPRPDRERGREIPPERRHLPKPSRPDASDGRAPVALRALAAVAILVVAGVVTVGLLRRQPDAPSDDLAQVRTARATRKAGAGAPRLAPAEPPPASVPGIASAEGVVPAEPAAEPGQERQAQPPDVSPVADGNTAQAQEAPESKTAPQPAAPAEPLVINHTIRIQATEVTRVRLVCSGKLTLDQELWPNQVRTLSCAEPVVMGADNAGAIQYAIDGQAVALLGAIGERVEEVQLAPTPPPAESAPQTPGSETQTPPGGAHGRR